MEKVRRVADCARMHHVPIRIGVNSGSIEKDILRREGGVTARGMLDSALSHARLLEEAGFHDIVLSLKASSVPLTVAAYELAAKETDYPLHVGVTEAGLPGSGNIKSAIGIGALLLQGIGDTVRVSLTGSPIPEAQAAIDILRACGLRKSYVNVVSCPTCGRTGIDVAAIARRVQEELSDIRVPMTVAVMGCVVNGPGEAREADVGLAGPGRSPGNGKEKRNEAGSGGEKGRGWSGGLCAGGCRSFVLPAPLERRYDPFGGHAAVGRAAVGGWKSRLFGERQAASAVFAGVRADFRLLPAAGGAAG